MTRLLRIAVVAVVGVCLFASLPSQADLQVNFNNNWGIYAYGQSAGGSYITAGTLIQLIWSPVNAIAPMDDLDPTTPQGSEQLLFSTFGPDEGGWGLTVVDLDGPAIYLDTTYGVTLANGWIYARVFDAAAPGNADHYLESGLVDGNEWTNLFLTELNVATVDGVAVDQTINAIPEPMSVAMFGLGLISLVVVRFRRK